MAPWPSILTRSVGWSPRTYRTAVAVLAALTVGLSFASVALTPPGLANTIWWPATGVGVSLGLLYRGPAWHVLLLVGSAASSAFLVFGRPPSYVAMSAALSITAVAVFLIAARRVGPLTSISTTRDLGRFVIVTSLAASGIGTVGGFAFWSILGQAPWQGFVFYFAAHFSAITLITPIVLVPLHVGVAHPREDFTTGIALIVAVSGALMSGGSFATASLVFPILAWSALRGRFLITMTLVLTIGIVLSAATAWGFGPFSEAHYSATTTATVQLFLLSIAITVLSIVSVRSERAALRAEAERRTELLEGGFIASQVGLAVVRWAETEQSIDVLEENAIAHELLQHPAVAAAVGRSASSTSTASSAEVVIDDGRALEVYARRLTGVGGDQILGVQIVDTTDAVAVRESLRSAIDAQRTLSLREQAFIARISHEFRTPITSILGFTEVLHESASAEQSAHLAVVARNAARLQGLTEELLSASVFIRSDTVGRHDLHAIMLQAVARSERRARDRSVAVEVAGAEGCAVDVAPAILSLFLDRLLERAIDSSPSGSAIRAQCQVDGRFASVTISDSGAPLGVETTIHFAEKLVRAESESASAERHLPVGASEAIAQLFGCQLQVEESPLGGVSVRLQFERALPGD